MAALTDQLIRQLPLNRPARYLALVWSLGLLFYRHYHQHVKQNCEWTSDAVYNDGDDQVTFELDILYFTIHGCIRKLACSVSRV